VTVIFEPNLSRLVRRTALLAFVLIAPSAAGQASSPGARLEVRGDSGTMRIFSSADLAALPHEQVTASEHEHTSTFAGIPLDTILRRAGVPIDSVRGARAAMYVLVEARDGYRALYSLAELASDLGGGGVLLVDARDGAPLAEREGPLRLVNPGDQRPTRWVRQVTTLVVRRAP
jgi:hypothetical protein